MLNIKYLIYIKALKILGIENDCIKLTKALLILGISYDQYLYYNTRI